MKLSNLLTPEPSEMNALISAHNTATDSHADIRSNLNSVTARVEVLENPPFVYGIDYNTGISTASSACQKVILQNGAYVNVSYFEKTPAHAFKRCVMDDLATRHVAYYLDPEDSTKKADGTAAILTGADGDVMVEFPITYWRIDHYADANGNAHTVYLISDSIFPNSEPHPFFYISPGGATLRKQYVGAFQSVICDATGTPLTTNIDAGESSAYSTGRKARSVIGAKPYTGMTQATHRTAAANNGAFGVNSLFKQFLQLMMYIEGGSFDTQTTISPGFMAAKTWNYRFTRLTGRTVGFGNGTGSIFYDSTRDGNVGFTQITANAKTYYRYQSGDANNYFGWRSGDNLIYTASDTPANGDAVYSDTIGTATAYTSSGYSTTPKNQQVVAFSYRGIENPYGNIWEFEDGAVADTTNGWLYHTPDTDKYSDTAYLTAYLKTAHAFPQSGLYPKTWDERTFFALTGGGSTTTYLCDSFAAANATSRVVMRGGLLSYGMVDGAGFVNVANALTYTSDYLGARIAC